MLDRHKRSSYAIYHKSGFSSGSIQLNLQFACFFAVSMWLTRIKLWSVLHGSFVIFAVCSGEQSDSVDPTTDAGITTEETDNPSISFTCPFDEKNDESCRFPLSSEESTCNWRLYDGKSPNFPNTGPPSGHEGLEDGYLLFESNLCDTTKDITTATITAEVPVSDSNEKQQCLQFWYFMYGGPNSLDVSVKFENDSLPTERKKFHREGNQGRRWFPAHVTIDNVEKKAYNLSFTAKARNSNAHAEMKLGDIAIDDVEFADGGCNKTMDLCDFESGDLCGFKANPKDTGADSWWNLTKAMESDVTDHTFQTSEGHVASCDLDFGKTARLVSEAVPVAENKSPQITFWYQIGTLGQLGVRIKTGNPSTGLVEWTEDTLVWSTNSSFSPYSGWNFVSVAASLSRDTSSEAIVFAFEASAKSVVQTGDGEVFNFVLDDIMVVMDDAAPYNPPNCDFENDECGWTSVGPNYNVGNNWVHFRGKDNLGEYGPYVDHTLVTEEGHFMLFSSDYQSNAAAIHRGSLWSPRISRPIVPFVCFSFWHYTYKDRRANMDLTLTLHEPALDGSAGNRTLIQLTNPPENRWTFVNVTVVTVGDYQLVFNQTFYNASRGNVLALDDFQSKEGECHAHLEKFNCTISGDEQIDPWKVCDGRYDCIKTVSGASDELMCGNFTSLSTNAAVDGTGFFNFTETTGYIVTNTTGFQWQYFSHCDAPNTAADADCHLAPGAEHPNHTFSLGFFKADFAGSLNETWTYLHSPTIHRLFSTTTMTFWYKIYSPNQQGALIVSLQMISTNTIIALLDVRAISEGDHSGKQWQQHNVTVGRMEGPLHFLFQARKAQSSEGFIAVDEILIEDRMFPVAVPGNEQKCDSNPKLWHCNVTHVCIEQDKRCDFTDDCGEREDESEVECRETHRLRCSFDDNSLCSFWEHHADSNAHWLHTTTLTSTPYSGPLRDHTTGLKGGGYIHAPSEKGNVTKGHKAILSSPVLAPVAETERCHMRFYYHMFGEDMGSLIVTTDIFRSTDDSPSMVIEHLFHAEGNHGDHWLRASVEFKSKEPFRVVLTAIVGGVRSDLALDDISFSQNCKLYNHTTSSTVPSVTVPSRQTVIPDATKSTSRDPEMSPVTGADKPTVSTGSTTVKTVTIVVGSHGLGGGAIAGIVIGLLVVLAGGFVLLILYSRKRTSGSVMPRGVWSRGGNSNYEEFDDTENLEL